MISSCPLRVLTGVVYAAVVIGVTACSGGGGGGSPVSTTPPPIVVTRTFPAGDAIAAGGGTAWDIVGVKTTLFQQFHGGNGQAYDTLQVDVTFNQDVSNALPAPGQPLSNATQLGLGIGLDIDAHSNTGNYKICNNSTGSAYEYGSDVGNGPSRLTDGNYSILGGNGPIYQGPSNPPSEAQTMVNGKTVSQTFYLSAIGVAAGPSIPNIRIAVGAVNGSNAADPATDCVPIDGTAISTNGS